MPDVKRVGETEVVQGEFERPDGRVRHRDARQALVPFRPSIADSMCRTHGFCFIAESE